MNRSRGISLLAGVALPALLVVGLLWWINRDAGPAPGLIEISGAHAAAMREAQREFRTISTKATLDDLPALRDTLSRTDLSATDFTSIGADGRADELLDLTAEFLHARFGQGDPREYVRWRTNRGYRWRDWAELDALWSIEEEWPLVVKDRAFPGAGAHAEAFAGLFDPTLDWKGGHNRPVAIASEPKGLGVVTGVMTRGAPTRELISGEMGPEYWHGSVAATACSWWDPPHTIDALLERFGSADYADVGMILEYADGSRRPVIITWVWDPTIERWTLQHLNSYNTDPNLLSPWHY